MKRKWVALVAAACLLAGCAGPDQKMQTEAARAARDAASEVRTARLAAQSLLDQKVWTQPAVVVVSDAEEALGTVATGFSSRQPETDESRKTYDLYSEALTAAEDGVTELRIALNRQDRAAVTAELGQLTKTGEQLVQLGERAK
jgi:hypothetical protein